MMLLAGPRLLKRRGRAGFTLVELMTVVAITGVLAAIGVTLVKGHISTAKAGRALVGVQAIRVAEEQYRAQGGQYLGCSTSVVWYPNETPGSVEQDWRKPTHAHGPCWITLGVPRNGGTQYGYLVNAGRPGDAYPALQTTNDPTLPNPAGDVWYVIQVKGNIDGDAVPMLGVATSFSGETYIENESE